MKYTASNLVEGYKARLVARGFTQIFGIDYKKTFSPILQYKSLQMLLFLAAYYGFEIKQMDILNAYLKGNLEKEIYMEILERLTLLSDTKDYVLRLKKSLYRLKQSGRKWNKKISQFCNFIRHKAITSNSCIFVNHATQVVIALYKDDLLIFSKSKSAIKKVKVLLNCEYKMKDLGAAWYVLGIRIWQEDKKIILD